MQKHFNLVLNVICSFLFQCVGFHPNGSYLATGSSDTSVRLWSVDSGELVRVLDGHRAPVMCLSFSADGNYIATAGKYSTIRRLITRLSPLARPNIKTSNWFRCNKTGDGTILNTSADVQELHVF